MSKPTTDKLKDYDLYSDMFFTFKSYHYVFKDKLLKQDLDKMVNQHQLLMDRLYIRLELQDKKRLEY